MLDEDASAVGGASLDRVRALALADGVITEAMITARAGALSTAGTLAERHALTDAELMACISAAVRGADDAAADAAVRGVVLDALARRDPMQGRSYEPAPQVGGSWDGPAGMRARLADALAARLDPGFEPTMGRDFASLRLDEICAEVCRLRGKRVLSKQAAIGMCLGRAAHTTSDFALITGNAISNLVGRRFLQRQPDLVRASREVTRIDYHEGRSLQLSASGMPEEIAEGAEIRFSTLDEKGEKLPAPRDFGAGFNLTNKAVANDRYDLLAQAGERMTHGAVEQQRTVLLEPLLANAGAGQFMIDGAPMFHATHGNLASEGSFPSIASLSEARTAMRKQRDSQQTLYGLTPWALVVPAELETDAQQLVAEITAAKTSDANPFAGGLEIIVDPGLSDPLAWYLIADPQLHDGLQHAYLDGGRAPRVESRAAWNTLGLEMRLVWALDAKFVETATWWKNPGAAKT